MSAKKTIPSKRKSAVPEQAKTQTQIGQEGSAPQAEVISHIEALNRARALFMQGQAAAAEQLIHQILQVVPEEPECFQILGAVAMHAKKYAQALELFVRVLDKVPLHYGAHHNRAIALRNMALMASSNSPHPWPPQIPPGSAVRL